MAKTENGVPAYSWATVRIPFPKGDENCWSCPLLNTAGKRMYCMRTGEIIIHEKSRPRRCELEFEEDANETIPSAET